MYRRTYRFADRPSAEFSPMTTRQLHGKTGPDRAGDRSRRATWLTPLRPSRGGALRLVMAPHAGGAPSSLRTLAGLLDPRIDVLAAYLPGRERRFAEPARPSLSEYVPELAAAVGELAEPPYALFGHSMGGLLAFEVARRLAADGRPAPVCLVLSASPAPHRGDWRADRHLWDDARLADWMAHLGGVDPEVRADRELMGILLPTLRADLAACETHVHQAGPALGCPLIVFGGGDDPMVSADVLGEWSRHTRGGARVEILPGGHFYLFDDEQAFADRLSAAVLQAAGLDTGRGTEDGATHGAAADSAGHEESGDS
jgi:surfactin synthase thioesterase subunit